jgi:hypothetical protein
MYAADSIVNGHLLERLSVFHIEGGVMVFEGVSAWGGAEPFRVHVKMEDGELHIDEM